VAAPAPKPARVSLPASGRVDPSALPAVPSVTKGGGGSGAGAGGDNDGGDDDDDDGGVIIKSGGAAGSHQLRIRNPAAKWLAGGSGECPPCLCSFDPPTCFSPPPPL
jgi:hypothetical protein